MRNVDTNNPEEAGRGAIRAATGSIRELASKTKRTLAGERAVTLGDPGRKGTEGPSALSYGLDFERTAEESHRPRKTSAGEVAPLVG